MKAYTDLEQSKRLIELGIDVNTADIIYNIFDESYIRHDTPIDKYHRPAWSIAALLAILPASCDDGRHCFALINSNPNGNTEWLGCYEDCNGNLLNECYADNPIDACYELILKLHEQKLL